MAPASLALVLPIVVVLLIVAVPALVAARRGWAGTLRRDGRLGVHARASSISDEAFRVSNRVAAPVVGGSGLVALIAAILAAALRLPATATLLIGLLGLVGAMALLLAGGVLGERAARTVPIPARRPGSDGATCDGCSCGGGGCAGLTRISTTVAID